MINVMLLLLFGIALCTSIILTVNLSACLYNPPPVLPTQGHPHYHRKDQTSRVTIHPCKLDLRTLA